MPSLIVNLDRMLIGRQITITVSHGGTVIFTATASPDAEFMPTPYIFTVPNLSVGVSYRVCVAPWEELIGFGFQPLRGVGGASMIRNCFDATLTSLHNDGTLLVLGQFENIPQNRAFLNPVPMHGPHGQYGQPQQQQAQRPQQQQAGPAWAWIIPAGMLVGLGAVIVWAVASGKKEK